MKVDEHLLWKFIDRDCTRAQILAVRRAVAEDPAVGRLYTELVTMHQQMVCHFARRVPLLPELDNYISANPPRANFISVADHCLN